MTIQSLKWHEFNEVLRIASMLFMITALSFLTGGYDRGTPAQNQLEAQPIRNAYFSIDTGSNSK